jgi:PKD repeat protein
MVTTLFGIRQGAVSHEKRIFQMVRRLVVLLLFTATANVTLADPVNILTYHGDNAHTGLNTNETVLTLANVNTNTFGTLFTYAVDGYVTAQPLVLMNVAIPSNGVHDVVYVATEHDSIYAFDADSNAGSNAVPLWQVSFIDPTSGITTVSTNDVNCSDVKPEIGITSTPVIDPTSGTIYIEAKTKEVVSGVTNFVHRLHALDVTTGAEKFGGPVLIEATVPGTGDGTDGLGNVSFNPLTQFTRTGLLLNNGVVYFGYASHCDNGFYHGWLFGFDAATLATNGLFNTTPNGSEGGIWESGCGPASDTNGNLYIATGNGTFDPTNSNYGDSLIRLSTSNSVALADYFTPFNQQDMFDMDQDLGSGGVLLLPDEAGSVTHPHLAVFGSKQGTIYLVDRDNMGQFSSIGDTQIVESILAVIGPCFDTPAYFNNTLYFSASHDMIKAFAITNGFIAPTPVSQGTTNFAFPGSAVSISANGTNDGIAWAIQSDGYLTNGPSILHAYDAGDVSQEIYNSSQAGPRDILGGAVKFSVPTIANGKVYVGTATGLSVFGNLVTAPTIAPNGGTFTNTVLVSLTNNTPGSVIYYSLDNSDPSTNSTLYAGPFSQTTSATVTTRAFLGDAMSAAASANFTIISQQPPSASFTGFPTTGTIPLTVTFTDSSTGTITNRSWTFGDGGTTNTLNTTVAYTYNSAGTDTVTLVASGPLGDSTNTQVNYIVATTPPPQQIVSPVNFDFGLLPVGQSSTQTFSVANAGFQTLNGTATVSGTPFAIVSGSPYTVNGGQTGLVTVSFNPVAAGAFTDAVVFASNGGVSTNPVTGSAAVAPTAGFTGSPTDGAATLLVNFADASSGTVTGWAWAFGDGSTSSLTNPSHAYTNAGTFSVNLTVFGPLGSNTLLLANYITVTNAIGVPVADFIASPTNGAAPLLVNFTDASTGSITNHSWNFGDGNTSLAVNPSHTYSTTGTYSVALTVSGPGGSSATNPANLITVTNVVTGPPTVTILHPANGMLYPPVTNATITVIGSASAHDGGTISKIEFFVDGTKFGQTTANPGTNFVFNPTFANHIIMVRATDSLGVTNSSTVTVTVGAKNSPLGSWEVTVSGVDKGAQFLTFNDDFTASGFGIRLKKFGLDDVSGDWIFNPKGQVTGPFLEQTLGATNWSGTLLGTVKSLKSVSGTVPTAALGSFRWKGIPATTFRDLSGTWTGAVTVARATTAASYLLRPNANDSGVFDIATSAAPGAVVGQLLITSLNKIYGYLAIGGKQATMSGSFNLKKSTMSLKGTDNTGDKVSLQLIQ